MQAAVRHLVAQAEATHCLAGIVQVLGQHAAELAVLSVRDECCGNGLGSLLLGCIDSLCSGLGVQLLAAAWREPAATEPKAEGISADESESQQGSAQGWLQGRGFVPTTAAEGRLLQSLPLLLRPGAMWLVRHMPWSQVVMTDLP